MKKFFGTFLVASFLFAGVAGAQDAKQQDAVQPQVKVGQVGLIAGKDPLKMVLRADKIGVTGKLRAGAECDLRPGDKVKVVEVLADGVLVQRQLGLHARAPSLTTCPAGSVGKLGTASAFAAVKAQEAAEAKKVVDKGPPKKK